LGSTIKDNVVKSMTDKLDDAKDTFFKAGQGLMDMLKDGLYSMKDKVLGTMSDIAGQVRDFLPFSPAKTGPLSDLDHLDFGGPISDSIKLAFPQVSGLMSKLLDLPDITANTPGQGLQNRAVNTTNNNTPISVTLNYNGNGNENDMMNMVDMIEDELSRRLTTKQFMLGGR
ncbi:carbamoyl-phosphate synthase, partial [Bacillus wiedmannii]